MQYFCFECTFCLFNSAENDWDNDIEYMLNILSFMTGWITYCLILNLLWSYHISALLIMTCDVGVFKIHVVAIVLCKRKVYVYNGRKYI